MEKLLALWELPGFRIGLIFGMVAWGLWGVITTILSMLIKDKKSLEPDPAVADAIAVLQARGMVVYPYWLSLKKSVEPGDEVLAKALEVLEPHTRYVILDEDGRVFGDGADVQAARMKLH